MKPFLLDSATKELSELRDAQVHKLLQLAEGLGASTKPTYKETINGLQHMLTILSEMSATNHKFSYSVTRRIVLGLVLHLHASLSRRQARKVEDVVNNIKFEFYRLHREAAALKKTVQFHHISKCGGTGMCRVAKKAGCSTQNFAMSWNCRIKEFGDTPIWTVGGFPDPKTGKMHFPFFSRGWPFRPAGDQLDSCSQRAKYLREAGYDFFANELYLVHGLQSPVHATPCDDFLNVIILRRPVARMLSNLKHISAYYLNIGADPPRGLAAFNGTAPAVLDNYTTRMLLGHWIFDLKLGGIHEAHLELAKLKLQQFDLVMLLEQPDELHVTMKFGLGWNTTLRDIGKVNTGNLLTGANPSPELQLTEQDMHVLTTLNKYDAQLYEYASSIQAIDMHWLEGALKVAKQRSPSWVSESSTPCGYVHSPQLQR